MISERVICAVDGSPESLDAAWQAARVTHGELTLVTVLDPWDLVLYGAEDRDPSRGPNPREVAEQALAGAEAEIQGRCEFTSRLIQGRPQHVLIDEVNRTEATLLVVGTHGRGRIPGIVLGSVATAMVHDAPCPVLVARGRPDGFPRTAVLGIDGSPGSVVAAEAAAALNESAGTTIRALVVRDGSDTKAALAIAGELPVDVLEGAPVEALVGAASDADLVVVGSRGVHGLRALGSVSERVVHRAPCSVLVARAPSRTGVTTGRGLATVTDIMSSPAVVAPVTASIHDLTRLMLEHRVGAVPIVDADGKVCGLVAETDFTGREVRFGRWDPDMKLTMLFGHWLVTRDLESIYRAAETLTASDVMTSPVATALPDEPVEQVVERMVRHNIKHLPVVRDGEPVGMLARHDLLKLAARTWGDVPHESGSIAEVVSE